MNTYVIKEDCFAYDSNNKKCKALECLYCKKEENCSFYRTKEENRIAKTEAEQRATNDTYITKQTIKVLYKEPGCEPIIKVIAKDLTAMQKLVEGVIATLPIEDTNYVIFFNDEGKIKNLEPNINLENDDYIAGKLFIALDDPENESIKSLTYADSNLLKRYLRRINVKK